jgi:prepilin-type N-terminal cleavage/methylation domain-containing protein/prepilin-type processing-associated H-X9-DG protein
MKKRSGFTLIELLVVICIIAILAAILYPVFASARRKVKQTVCSSNLRQLGMAVLMYANDHDGYPPLGAYDWTPPPSPAAVRVDWEDELISAAYVKTYSIYRCPADSNQDYRAAYGSNRWVMGWAFSPLLDAPPYPAHTVLLTEKTGDDWVAFPPDDRTNNPYYRPLDPRHESRLNILYVDGHIGDAMVNELIGSPTVIWRY